MKLKFNFELVEWWFLHIPPVFWYWVNQQFRGIWECLSEDKVSTDKIDWVATIGYSRYCRALDRLVASTGRSIYGRKL
jgi:hypothetical protein